MVKFVQKLVHTWFKDDPKEDRILGSQFIMFLISEMHQKFDKIKSFVMNDSLRMRCKKIPSIFSLFGGFNAKIAHTILFIASFWFKTFRCAFE